EHARADDLDVNITREKKLTKHPVLDRGGAGTARATAPAHAGAGDGVLPPGRVHRGHPDRLTPPEGDPRPDRTGPRRRPPQAHHPGVTGARATGGGWYVGATSRHRSHRLSAENHRRVLVRA